MINLGVNYMFFHGDNFTYEAQINNSFKVDAQGDTKTPDVNMLQDTQILV